MTSKQRPELKKWLEKLVNEGKCGLRWLSERDGTFIIPWCNQKNREWSKKYVALSLEWAKYTGRHKEGDKPDFQGNKARLRCALNKNPDIEALKNGPNIPPKHKGYKFILKHNNNPQLPNIDIKYQAAAKSIHSLHPGSIAFLETQNQSEFLSSPGQRALTITSPNIPVQVQEILLENTEGVATHDREHLSPSEKDVADSNFGVPPKPCENDSQILNDKHFEDNYSHPLTGSPSSQIETYSSIQDTSGSILMPNVDIGTAGQLQIPEYMSYCPSYFQQSPNTQSQVHGQDLNVTSDGQQQCGNKASPHAFVEIGGIGETGDSMGELSNNFDEMSVSDKGSLDIHNDLGSLPSKSSFDIYVPRSLDTQMPSTGNLSLRMTDQCHARNEAQRPHCKPVMTVKIFYGSPHKLSETLQVTENKCLILSGQGHSETFPEQNIQKIFLKGPNRDDISDKQRKDISTILDGMKGDGLLLYYDVNGISVERRCLSKVFITDGSLYSMPLARTKKNRPSAPTVAFDFDRCFKAGIQHSIEAGDKMVPASHFVMTIGGEIIINDASPMRRVLMHIIVTHCEADSERLQALPTSNADNPMISDPDSWKHKSAS